MRFLATSIGMSVALAGIQVAKAQLVTFERADQWSSTGEPAIRGITVGPIESSQQPDRGYGTDASDELLRELAAMGANWVSITPFGRLWSLSSTEVLMDFEAPYSENRQAVQRMIQQAHRHGLRVLIIPHLWIETTGWRGQIDPGDPERWNAYRESYAAFVTRWARDAAAAGADAFSIGVECTSWSWRFGNYWTELIAELRSIFPGFLTYSANWDEVEDVIFWEQLDFIGVNAFYPLASHNDAAYDEYVATALGVMHNLRGFARMMQRPVVFVEVGYTTRTNAAVEPWLWPDHMANVRIDEYEQARALSALFEAFLPEPWFAGFFLWRYYAHLADTSQEAAWGFSPHGKVAERYLIEVFETRWGADPPPWPWLSGMPTDAPRAAP